MRLVVQRVKSAQVKSISEDKVIGKIGVGLFILLGVTKGDSQKEVEILTQKLFKLRVMKDENDKMNLSIKETGGEMLVVSQFTLNADTTGGNRPSFINAEEPEKARNLYELFISKLRELGIKVETGKFGDYMEINAILDGPVTILY